MQSNKQNPEVANDLLPIISLPESVQVVDSRLIANELGVQHKNLMETIKNYQEKVECNFGSLTFETEVRKREVGATTVRFAYLTEDQAIFLATLSRNTEQVVAFKAKLVKSFSEARKQANALPPKPKKGLSYMQQPAEITREEWVVAQHWLNDVQARVNKMEAVFWETVGKVETLSVVNNENRYDTVQDYFEAMGEVVTPAQLSYLIKLCKGISKSNGVMIGNYGHGVMSFSKQVLAIAYSNFVTTGGKVA